jgi:hypothetical protein
LFLERGKPRLATKPVRLPTTTALSPIIMATKATGKTNSIKQRRELAMSHRRAIFIKKLPRI